MFSHLLAGELVFLFLGLYFGFDISAKFLIFGAFCGFSPDILSHIFGKTVIKLDKWYYRHRDNFSHSLILPFLVFFVLFFWVDIRLALIISLAMLSHIFFDLWGIGWGVKLFLPFSSSIYKFFHKGKFLYKFSSESERTSYVQDNCSDDWFQVAYFFSRPSKWLKWWGVFEWLSLAIAITLIILAL